MLRYKCLVLDHDDTVVASEAAVNYPCFLEVLDRFRPGEYMELDEFTWWCFQHGYGGFMQLRYNFNEQERAEEFAFWKEYCRTHIPPAYPGLKEILLEHKRRGGYICVSSHSARSTIERDYEFHFGIQPDMVFSWDMPEETRKPEPYALLKAMETYGLEAKDLLMIDDLKPGYDMAKRVGVDFAFAGWGRKNVPQITEFMEKYCDYSFDDTKKLYSFLFERLDKCDIIEKE